MKRPAADSYEFHSNLGLAQGIDFASDFMHAFGANLREACQHVPPVFNHKKSAAVIPLRRPAAPPIHQHEVPSCLSDICPKPTSES